jgi:acyl-CoA reductase-like NAD-dependent aldehyde dehydrogenase
MPVPAPAPPTVPSAAAAAAPIVSPAEPGGSHWSRIELALRSSILQAIADALPQHVDNIVRNRMNDAIDRLLTQLVAETRLAVAASLRDIVDQAVRAELARLRNQR